MTPADPLYSCTRISMNRPTRIGRAISFFTVLAITMLHAVHLHAQVVQECDAPGGAIITGVVVDDSTGERLGGARVELLVAGCYGSADADGRFAFRGVPPGMERVGATHPGYRRFAPIQLTLERSDTIAIEVRLKPGGPIQDCRVDAACARLLLESGAEALSAEERFRVATLTTAIAIAWQDVASGAPWHACTDESSAAVIAVLRDRYGPVVHSSQCAVTQEEDPQLRVRVRLASGGAPAFFVHVDNVNDVSEDHRTAIVQYVVAPLWAQGWRCRFERMAGKWEPTECVLVMES